MSLLQSLPYKEYQRVLTFNTDQCKYIAKIADLRNINFDTTKKPGELLIKSLDRHGFSVHQYKKFLETAQSARKNIYYKPQSKIAILIGNDNYIYLNKLATPSIDCESLSEKLKTLGFTVITLKNLNVGVLKDVIVRLFRVIPEDSYCFIYYAGHGCEVCSVKCMLGVDCPDENITLNNVVTENFILDQSSRSKPDLCILLMDMCRVSLDRQTNPDLFNEIVNFTEYTIHKNLVIGYSTLSAQSAYEEVQIECSESVDSKVSYMLKSGDIFVQGASQYANALCRYLCDDLDVNSMLDKVHEDVENAPKKQRPIKVQCGTAKRSLHDPAIGDVNTLIHNLQEINRELYENDTP